ncbi:hypothetical protein P278_19480 [Zhouia amylolytica AD3]|uniref:Uncharacterized protein n=1 Tax=Zhouia amylolytica AD3 TaxID=1286632 RepID=W2UMG0_9FLAO|nr:hypothetical protein P278_19480 [Zhouia amylolytica AD3]
MLSYKKGSLSEVESKDLASRYSSLNYDTLLIYIGPKES